MTEHLWWQRGIVYEIVPHSFMDANGDGVGDLEGIRRRLDYLAWLGVDALWLSPIYPSPMADFGYDVSDYRAIHPLFGTMDDFDRLLEAVHAKGLRLILDFVPNHTSSEHPWFRESRSSRDNAKRDWYLWHDAAPGGGPPNNWLSVFGGPAWTFDEATGQYYYHAFTAAEVDLNWRNPAVVEAMLDAMRFWLDKGVDGFRVDAAWYLIKDERLRDNPENPGWDGARAHERLTPAFSEDRPEVHPLIQRMREVVDAYDDRVLVGEFYLSAERLVSYYGPGGREIHLPNNFLLATCEWDAGLLAHEIARYEGMVPPEGWPNWVLGNHDLTRTASRLGQAQARVAAMLLLTLRGTAFLYYGDEIGLENVEAAAEARHDPQTRDYAPGSRMPVRTPMPWKPGPGAGFTTGTPWLPLSPDCETRNVEAQRQQPDSLLHLYRRLIALRKQEPALWMGDYLPLPPQHDLLAYVRAYEGRRFLVVLNLGGEEATYATSKLRLVGRVVAATRAGREGETVRNRVEMQPGDGLVILLD